MSLEYQIDPQPTHLHTTVQGPFDLTRIKELFPQLLAACEEHDTWTCLIDCRQLTGRIPIMARYDLGCFMAKNMAHTMSIAIVASKKHIVRDRFMETVARNRGALLKVVTTTDEAQAWLLGSVPSDPAAN